MSGICTQCGYEGKGKKILRGSKAMEVFIWAVLLVPGPFYSIWRRAGVQRSCLNCGRTTMVSLKSDAGFIAQQMLLKELDRPGKPPASTPQSPAAESPAPPPAAPRPARKPVDPNQW